MRVAIEKTLPYEYHRGSPAAYAAAGSTIELRLQTYISLGIRPEELEAKTGK